MLFYRKTPLAEAQQSMAYASHVSKLEQREVEHAFARLFATDDGRKVLAWLQMTTFQRAAGIDTADAQLRYMEGQRGLVASILRMIDRGRTN